MTHFEVTQQDKHRIVASILTSFGLLWRLHRVWLSCAKLCLGGAEDWNHISSTLPKSISLTDQSIIEDTLTLALWLLIELIGKLRAALDTFGVSTSSAAALTPLRLVIAKKSAGF